jgi:hypothetical protein
MSVPDQALRSTLAARLALEKSIASIAAPSATLFAAEGAATRLNAGLVAAGQQSPIHNAVLAAQSASIGNAANAVLAAQSRGIQGVLALANQYVGIESIMATVGAALGAGLAGITESAVMPSGGELANAWYATIQQSVDLESLSWFKIDPSGKQVKRRLAALDREIPGLRSAAMQALVSGAHSDATDTAPSIDERADAVDRGTAASPTADQQLRVAYTILKYLGALYVALAFHDSPAVALGAIFAVYLVLYNENRPDRS